MGICVCGQPIGLVPRACRIEDRALLWPPVRVNPDLTEHRCRKPERRSVRIVEPIPPSVQAALLNEQAARETTAAVAKLANVLADESQARQDYYRQRAGRPPGAVRPSAGGVPSAPPASEGAVCHPPAANPHLQRSLADEIGLESEAV